MARPRTPKGRCLRTHEELKVEYPDAECELEYKNAFQLLAATILSAQATDVSVNKATPDLFKRFSSPEELSVANVEEVETYINSIGLFRGKAKNLVGMAQRLVEEFDSQVPESMGDLVSLPGVGRKTANCVLGEIYNVPSMVVDTHMIRIMNLLNFTKGKDAKKIEFDLMELFEEKDWVKLTHMMIDHGRAVCIARRPQCNKCIISRFCPSFIPTN